MKNNIIQVYGVTTQQLKESTLLDVRAELKAIAQNYQPKKRLDYFTGKEVASILKLPLFNLTDWNNKKSSKTLQVVESY